VTCCCHPAILVSGVQSHILRQQVNHHMPCTAALMGQSFLLTDTYTSIANALLCPSAGHISCRCMRSRCLAVLPVLLRER